MPSVAHASTPVALAPHDQARKVDPVLRARRAHSGARFWRISLASIHAAAGVIGFSPMTSGCNAQAPAAALFSGAIPASFPNSDDDGSIRPFKVHVSGEGLVGLPRPVARQGVGPRSNAGRPVGDDAAAGALLANRLRLAQG